MKKKYVTHRTESFEQVVNRQNEIIQGIIKIMKDRRSLQQKMIVLVKELHPVGTDIQFKKGRGFVNARILEHDGFYEKMKVYNHKTKKEYWMDYYDVLDLS